MVRVEDGPGARCGPPGVARMRKGGAFTPRRLVVGAGLTGATLAERIAGELGEDVLIVDNRAHVGGNAFGQYDAYGVMVLDLLPVSGPIIMRALPRCAPLGAGLKRAVAGRREP